ncbi:MmgE/PrpD family protein [Streptomyces coacervatus]|uniref:MmgE/PrpD family protein n=1 Tax=Streptomyces coacervatus TaxID=647381 RepID=UPI0023DC80FB|nr:MmgE/PrpD family protein [Streptomyces coacervatus]MDF2266126.1 MmgE/PrpD family protein [Streptomyces coacervatus]
MTVARALAERALADTVTVAPADDPHTDTTTHISVVTVPAVLASVGDARAYLAGAGVMARLGAMLGRGHCAAGWQAMCTAGAPAAAVAAGPAFGLDVTGLATAMALAVPAAGGGQEAFGTHGKSLQVGFAADAGVRAARPARAGATADPRALDGRLERVGGTPGTDFPAVPAVPGGPAVKLFLCCYAMQRPIAALREVREVRDRVRGEVTAVTVSTPAGTVHPLIHDRPATVLGGKFSLPYAVAAVRRCAARTLVERVRADRLQGETSSLLDGRVSLRIDLADGSEVHTGLALPPGAPGRPLSDADLCAKAAACEPDVPALLDGLTWAGAAEVPQTHFPYFAHDPHSPNEGQEA